MDRVLAGQCTAGYAYETAIALLAERALRLGLAFGHLAFGQQLRGWSGQYSSQLCAISVQGNLN
jgi:hypothetical protein